MQKPTTVRRLRHTNNEGVTQKVVDELTNMLRAMVAPLADHPEEIVISPAIGQENVAFEVIPDDRDVGALVGQRGLHAKAIRLLLMRAAKARGIRTTVTIIGRDHHDFNPR